MAADIVVGALLVGTAADAVAAGCVVGVVVFGYVEILDYVAGDVEQVDSSAVVLVDYKVAAVGSAEVAAEDDNSVFAVVVMDNSADSAQTIGNSIDSAAETDIFAVVGVVAAVVVEAVAVFAVAEDSAVVVVDDAAVVVADDAAAAVVVADDAVVVVAVEEDAVVDAAAAVVVVVVVLAAGNLPESATNLARFGTLTQILALG